jgi:hypothetical protein
MGSSSARQANFNIFQNVILLILSMAGNIEVLLLRSYDMMKLPSGSFRKKKVSLVNIDQIWLLILM